MFYEPAREKIFKSYCSSANRHCHTTTRCNTFTDVKAWRVKKKDRAKTQIFIMQLFFLVGFCLAQCLRPFSFLVYVIRRCDGALLGRAQEAHSERT